MFLLSCRQMSVVALSAACAAPAFAGSQVQTTQFNFGMFHNPQETDCYEGSDAKTFNPFDTQGGSRSLDRVTLSLDMNISGRLFVGNQQPALLPAQDGEDGEAPIEITLSGTAKAAPSSATQVLTTEADFDTVEDDGKDSVVNINQDGSGSSAFASGNVAPYAGGEPINLNLSAEAMVVYNDLGQIGRAENLSSSGTATLTYDFSTAGNPPPPSVPTPAAVGGGLMLLAGLMLRRRV